MEEVLTQLGDPKEFAKKYQDREHYLIGPQNYDIYTWFTKIVLICTAVSVLVVSLIINGTGNGFVLAAGKSELTENIINNSINIISSTIINLITGCIMVFGVVTIIFAIIDK